MFFVVEYNGHNNPKIKREYTTVFVALLFCQVFVCTITIENDYSAVSGIAKVYISAAPFATLTRPAKNTF